MTTQTKVIVGVIAALGLLAAGFFAGRAVAPAFGTAGVNEYKAGITWFGSGIYAGSSQQLAVSSAGALTLGASGTSIAQLQKGTGSLIMSSYTVAPTSTVAADIAISGIQPGDLVFATFATSSAVFGGWEVVSASASSTAGYATLRIVNDTGASAVIPASIASSTPYLIVR
jgi:hypothetical protein